MDAVEYIKTLHRLCKSKNHCYECPLQKDGHCIVDISIVGTSEYAEKAVQIVEQWAKEFPVKTRQSEFLKQFPDARVNDNGILCLIPCCIEDSLRDKCGSRKCDYCRKAYWLEEVDE